MKNTILFYNFLLCALFAGTALYGQTLKGSFESIFKRYGKGEQFTGTARLTESLTAWKNERAYAHIIIHSRTAQDKLSYEAGPFISLTDTILAGDVHLLFARNVLADKQARRCGIYPQPRLDSIEIADALSFSPLRAVTPDDPLKIWVRVDVPRNIPCGMYSGTVKVKQDDGRQLVFTLNIEVLDKVLPESSRWTFHLDIWQYPCQILSHYNRHHPEAQVGLWSPAHFAMITPLYRLLADAGQKAVTVYITGDFKDQPSMVDWILKADGTWQYDFTGMDAWIDKMTDLGISRQINCFSDFGMSSDSLSCYDEASGTFKKVHLPAFSQAYYERWGDFLTVFKAHLKARSVFDRTVIYLDEVEPEVIPQFDRLIHGNDPEWKMGLAYFTPLTPEESSLLYDISGNLGRAGVQGRTGKISTFYTSCAQTVPNTYVTPENSAAEAAWVAWHAASMNLDGFLRWAYDFWTLDDPRDIRDSFHTSGDNSFVYRSDNELNAEIYTSYRLELLRKGIQDFEKRRILRAELSASDDPFDGEALELLDAMTGRFHEYSGSGAKTLVEEGSRLLNDIVRGEFSSCKVYGADSSAAYIRRLEVAGSDTPLGDTRTDIYPGGYSRYSGGKITALGGDTITLTVENSPGSQCARTCVWIDWNANGEFERVWSGGIAGSCENPTFYTFAVIIPVETEPGLKRMRIQVRDAHEEAPSPCGEVSRSSTRDFDLEVGDTYCHPLTRGNRVYFPRRVSTVACPENLDFSMDVLPSQGYVYDRTNSFVVEKGASFLLDIENSELSKCARTAIWADWNRNGTFDDPGEFITLLGDSASCGNPCRYRIPVTVPHDACSGATRMRIQLRDSYQYVPSSCASGYVTGTTDLKINVTEAFGKTCSPVIIYPYDGQALSDTVADFRWNANNEEISWWKLRISDADTDPQGNHPVFFEQVFDGKTTAARISGLPGYGENLAVELSWLSRGEWYSTTTLHRAADRYCRAAGLSGTSYFIHSLTSSDAAANISFLWQGPPDHGYFRVKNPDIALRQGNSFTLEIKGSSACSCAFIKMWIDWNADGDFTVPEEEVYAGGKSESCGNETGYRIRIDVPPGTSPGVKRLRIRLCNSWLPALDPCGGSPEITTYDVPLEVIGLEI